MTGASQLSLPHPPTTRNAFFLIPPPCLISASVVSATTTITEAHLSPRMQRATLSTTT